MSKQYRYPSEVREMFQGKTILVIGTGSIGLRFMWDSLKNLKLKVRFLYCCFFNKMYSFGVKEF